MSINDDVYSRTLKHRALLSLYEKRLESEILKILALHKTKLKNIVLAKGTANINLLNRSLAKEIRQTYKRIYKEGITELNKLAGVSARYYKSEFARSLIGIYKAKGVNDAITVKNLIIKGNGTFSQQLASISIQQQRKIKGLVKTGMVAGKSLNKIADDVGRLGIATSVVQNKTLIRTAITETSAFVANETYKLNDDVVKGYQYVATLDSRTSLICGRLDGKIYSLDSKSAPKPPQHFNCRSTTVPIIKSADQLLNTKNNRLQKRKINRLSDKKRASINGQVPARTNYSEWLSKQDNELKLTILGTQARVDIFNKGLLKLTQFSSADGKLVSLDKLESLLIGKEVQEISKRVSIQAAKEVDITKVISGRISDANKVRYNKQFNEQLTNQQKVIVNKFEKPKDIRSSGGVYYASTQQLKARIDDVDRGLKGDVKGYVMSHEYGHHIDYVTNGSRFQAWSEVNKEFNDAIALDRKKFMGKGKFKSMEDFLDKIAVRKTKEIYSKYNPERLIGKTTRSYLLGDGYGNISDILDAFVKGTFRADYGMWGHSKSYWKRSGSMQKEIFANMFSLVHDKKAWKLVQELAPETSKVFVKRLNDLEKLSVEEAIIGRKKLVD